MDVILSSYAVRRFSLREHEIATASEPPISPIATISPEMTEQRAKDRKTLLQLDVRDSPHFLTSSFDITDLVGTYPHNMAPSRWIVDPGDVTREGG